MSPFAAAQVTTGSGGPLYRVLPALPSLPGQARWRALLDQAQWDLGQLCQEMEDYAVARSESWQESERGEAFQRRLEAAQEVLAAVEELTVSQKNAAQTLDRRPQLPFVALKPIYDSAIEPCHKAR